MYRLSPIRGFTLIEVLLAIAITALLGVMAYTSFSAITSSIKGLQVQSDRITEINRAWALLSRDLDQFANRSIRNEFGAANPALMGGESAEQSLAFTRTGWHNTTGRVRSNLQRVRYLLEGTTLYREHYLVLDRPNDAEPQRVDLLTGVNALEFRFLDPRVELRQGEIDTENWNELWGVAGGGANTPPPEALEIRLELDDWGEVRWLYALPEPAI